MKKLLTVLTAAVMMLGMLTSCSKSDDSSSGSDNKNTSKESKQTNTTLDPEKVENGKKIAKAAIELGSIVLKPSMSGYVNRAQQKQANSDAKRLFTIVNAALKEFETDGRSTESSCAGKKIKASELKTSTELDKYIYRELSQNGSIDDANISFVIENGKVVRTKWQKDSSSPIGSYPQKAQ